MTDYLPISKVNTVVFCPRRFFIEHVLGDTQSNHHIAEGRVLHDKTIRPGADVWVWGDHLGLVGVVDKLEREGGVWVITEYKKGYLADHESDQVQLCAQAICTEAARGVPLAYGYLYYHSTRRKLRVDFTTELRARVEQAVTEMRQLCQQPHYPPVTTNRNKCRGCSVHDACQPTLGRHG